MSEDSKDIDFIFAPDIIQTYKSRFVDKSLIKQTQWDKSFTCPYLQNIGKVIAKNTVNNKPVINPHISFR